MAKNKVHGKFNFDGLFIFEVSKNHGGDVAHGLRIVREFSKIAKEAGVRGALKLQFQNLDSYIHPDKRKSDDPRVKRYFASRLSEKQFKKIIDEIHAQGMISMSTPFDEESVDMLDRLGVQIIKIASSSAKDWPLLKRVVQSKKPIVCSTGGLRIKEIDALVAFLKKEKASFAVLHCVGLYPTPPEEMHLNHIGLLRSRYKDVPIGLSTHEDPENLDAIKIAHAEGAMLYEKHVAILNKKFEADASFKKVLTYTAQPEQIVRWLNAYKEAVVMCGKGPLEKREDAEIASIKTMMRGVYLKHDVKKGTVLKHSDVFFAIPLLDGQMDSGSWKNGLKADKAYAGNEALAGKARS